MGAPESQQQQQQQQQSFFSLYKVFSTLITPRQTKRPNDNTSTKLKKKL
jgi:hypothetical protein